MDWAEEWRKRSRCTLRHCHGICFGDWGKRELQKEKLTSWSRCECWAFWIHSWSQLDLDLQFAVAASRPRFMYATCCACVQPLPTCNALTDLHLYNIGLNSVAPCMKPLTFKFEKIEIKLSVCWLTKYLSPLKNRNILGSAYSEVQVAVPCSISFQSSAFREWNLDILGTG